MFTSRLWATYGVTYVLTLVLGALFFHDLIGAILVTGVTGPYLFTCFIGLTLLSFVPRPPLSNPALQVAVFLTCFAVSDLTAAEAGAALLPLLGQPAGFDLDPGYYLYSLPVLGLTLLAVTLTHLARHPRFRRHQRNAARPIG